MTNLDSQVPHNRSESPRRERQYLLRFGIPMSLLDRLDRHVEALGQSRSPIIADSVREYLDRAEAK